MLFANHHLKNYWGCCSLTLQAVFLQSSKGFCSFLQSFSFKVSGRRQPRNLRLYLQWTVFSFSGIHRQAPVAMPFVFCFKEIYLLMSMVSFRNENVSQALVHNSSLQESASMCLQEEPTEGASNHVVVTSEQNLEPPTSLLPRCPSQDQKLYQHLLVIHWNFIFKSECNRILLCIHGVLSTAWYIIL